MPFLSSDTCCVYVSCKLNASVPEIYGKTILLYFVTSYSCSSTLNQFALVRISFFLPNKVDTNFGIDLIVAHRMFIRRTFFV